MRTITKKWLLAMGLILLWVSLPVVPVLRAAVIPDPVYHQIWVSLWQIVRYTLFPMPGLTYRLSGYSWAVSLLVIGIGIVAYRIFSKQII